MELIDPWYYVGTSISKISAAICELCRNRIWELAEAATDGALRGKHEALPAGLQVEGPYKDLYNKTKNHYITNKRKLLFGGLDNCAVQQIAVVPPHDGTDSALSLFSLRALSLTLNKWSAAGVVAVPFMSSGKSFSISLRCLLGSSQWWRVGAWPHPPRRNIGCSCDGCVCYWTPIHPTPTASRLCCLGGAWSAWGGTPSSLEKIPSPHNCGHVFVHRDHLCFRWACCVDLLWFGWAINHSRSICHVCSRWFFMSECTANTQSMNQWFWLR